MRAPELECLSPDKCVTDEKRRGIPPCGITWGITELAAREIELSYAGGCDAVLALSETSEVGRFPICLAVLV